MLCGSAASSFTDEIQKWQKQLQTIEAVLTVWLEVQDKWVELEDVSIRILCENLNTEMLVKNAQLRLTFSTCLSVFRNQV